MDAHYYYFSVHFIISRDHQQWPTTLGTHNTCQGVILNLFSSTPNDIIVGNWGNCFGDTTTLTCWTVFGQHIFPRMSWRNYVYISVGNFTSILFNGGRQPSEHVLYFDLRSWACYCSWNILLRKNCNLNHLMCTSNICRYACTWTSCIWYIHVRTSYL